MAKAGRWIKEERDSTRLEDGESIYSCPLGNWANRGRRSGEYQERTTKALRWPLGSAVLGTHSPACFLLALFFLSIFSLVFSELPIPKHSLYSSKMGWRTTQWINARVTSQLSTPRSWRETKSWLSGTCQNCQKQTKISQVNCETKVTVLFVLWEWASHFLYFFILFFLVQTKNK